MFIDLHTWYRSLGAIATYLDVQQRLLGASTLALLLWHCYLFLHR